MNPEEERIAEEYRNRSTPSPIRVELDRQERASLYVLLCLNPRPWNKKLREFLAQVVPGTDAFNAQRRMTKDDNV